MYTHSTIPDVLMVSPNDTAPFTVPHLWWSCTLDGPLNCFPSIVNALIDHSSHTVLINNNFPNLLGLLCHKLPNLMPVEMAMPGEGLKCVILLNMWVKLQIHNVSSEWISRPIRVIIGEMSVYLR